MKRRACIGGLLALGLGGVGGAALVACESSEVATFDQSAMLASLANEVALPLFERFATAAEGLREAGRALEQGATASSLSGAQAAWRAVRSAWMRTRAFAFGVAKTDQGEIEYAVDAAAIEAKLADTTPIDAAYPSTLGTDSKGLLALEYLLFDAEAGDEAVLARFTDATSGERRRAYVRWVAEALADRAELVTDFWRADGGAFADGIAKSGQDGGAYATPQRAIDAFVNELVFASDVLANQSFAGPLGLDAGAGVVPEAEVCRRSDQSIADAQDTLGSIRDAWLGGLDGEEGNGLSHLLRSRDEALDGDVRAQVQACVDAVDAIPPPLREALLDAPETVQAAYDATIALKRLLATDVVNLLGVTLSFNDNDGD